MNLNAMLNAYPDSIGERLGDAAAFLAKEELQDAFRSFYILPTVFNTDLDRGFSVISYDLNQSLASEKELEDLRALGIDLTFDIILNHLSVLSPQFRDILEKGDESKYRNFFIDWNRFWDGRGEMTEAGYIRPDPDQFDYGNLRKNGLPILMVRLPDGRDVPYWNTFYQKVIYQKVSVFEMLDIAGGQYDQAQLLTESVNRQLDNGKKPAEMEWTGLEAYRGKAVSHLEAHRRYMGQMDVNYSDPLVREWIGDTMNRLASYGASMIRLDAFARLHKAPKRKNFVNEPETWQILTELCKKAKKTELEVIPEIHASYSKGYYKKLSELGCVTYDYFLPGLILDALDTGDSGYLASWAEEIIRDRLRTVNMLGCHDGIPMRDVRGLLPDERVDAMIERLSGRGGHKKIVHGVVEEVYQMDMTYYSALGCDDRKLGIARAIQMFMPGKPQVWYMDLLAGASDEGVFARDPFADTREVNRRRYTVKEAEACLERPVVREQLRLLKLRNTHPAFCEDADITVDRPDTGRIVLTWRNGSAYAALSADLRTASYKIEVS